MKDDNTVKEEIYVNKPLSFSRIMELLEEYPHLKKITIPTSLFARISPKYLQALEELGVTVVSIEKKGRPKKYSEKDTHKVHDLLKSGYSPREISENLNIPLKTIYYLKKSPLNQGGKINTLQIQLMKLKIYINREFQLRISLQNSIFPLELCTPS